MIQNFFELYLFMSVNIAERPTFEKRTVHFDSGVFTNVICLVLIFTSKLIVSVRMVTLNQCDSIEIIL